MKTKINDYNFIHSGQIISFYESTAKHSKGFTPYCVTCVSYDALLLDLGRRGIIDLNHIGAHVVSPTRNFEVRDSYVKEFLQRMQDWSDGKFDKENKEMNSTDYSGKCVEHMIDKSAYSDELKTRNEYKKMKAFFDSDPERLREYEEWVKENSKTELEKAAEAYCDKLQLANKISGPADILAFKEGVNWLISKWHEIHDINTDTTLGDIRFEEFIEKECK